jgi:hypothetical protein
MSFVYCQILILVNKDMESFVPLVMLKKFSAIAKIKKFGSTLSSQSKCEIQAQ